MTEYSSPSNLIKIDKHTGKIAYPTILLQGRSRNNIIGKISNYDNYNLSLVGVGVDEVSFDVPKYVNGVKTNHWDELVDLKVIELQKYGRFQIKVSYADDTQTVKSVIGQSLEVELAQIPLREFHINDEEDMDMVKTEYSEHKYDAEGNFIPVYFYNTDNPERSLLHMVLADKAPHWRIGRVPTYVSMSEDAEAELASEFMRTYTEDGTSIYDFLTGTVAQETNVVFVFDTLNRIINCYSLIDCYQTDEAGNRILVESGIGEDTLVFATKRNILNQVSIDSNEDQVKNCFFVEGGDDTINGMIAAVNMNGTRYIWSFSPQQLADMSEELRNKLSEYQATISDQSVKDEYYGENGIFTRLCNAYQELYLKESTMSPSLINVDPKTAEYHYNKIVNTLRTTTVYVSDINDYDSERFTGITNNVKAFAEVLTDSRYKVEVIKDSASFSSNKWRGKIKVTRNTDDTNTYPIDVDNSAEIVVNIGDGSTLDGQYEFVKQKIMKALASSDMQSLEFELTDDSTEIEAFFEQYALNRLKSFYDAYNECVSILEKYGLNTKSDVQETLYQQYQKVLKAIGVVRDKRQKEVDSINGQIETLISLQAGFADKYNLDLRKRLGEELYEEFCSYRREDTYSNPNYTSDSKETVAEQLQMAKELMDVANAELGKACMLQRTVSTSLGNLLVLPEFEQLYDSFALFNYIRIQTDDEVLKLRLIGIDFSGDSVQDINVTFSEQIESVDRKTSDIESILNSAQSMATSFPITVRQAKQGESANKEFIDIHTNGLSATKAMITNNDNNEVTITNIGLLAKRMDDEGYYGKKQLRITGNGMYLTDDAWENLRMAVGEIMYTNPITGVEEQAYGVIADTLIGNLIAGKQMHIGNENGSVLITGDGITITGGTIQWKNVNGLSEDLQKALDDSAKGIIEAAKGIELANKAQSSANTAQETADNANARAENAETNAKDYADEKDASLSATLTTAYKSYADSKVKALDDSVSDYLGLGGTTIVDDDYIISPYVGGGYLNISSGNKRVIIDPKNLGGTGQIFQVHSNVSGDDGIVIGFNENGDAVFNGHIHAKSLSLGTNKIPTTNISGLSTVATSGKYSDLSGKPTIPDSVEDLGLDSSKIIYKGDITQTTKTDSNGVSYIETSVPSSSGNITYSTYDAEDYLVFGRSKGTNSDGNNYVCVSKEGLLTARNAWIYGTIYATDGEFTGAIKGGTININDKFKVDENGNVTIESGTISWGSIDSPDDLATTGDIPKKVSQLTNDSGYQNASQVTTEATRITNNTIETGNLVAQNLHVNAANINGQLTASQINTTGLIAENISGATITGKTISGGSIEGASVNAINFTAYNDIYMQYKYGDTYGTKHKLMSLSTSVEPPQVNFGTSSDVFGLWSFWGDVYIQTGDFGCSGDISCTNLNTDALGISGHAISSYDDSLTLQNSYGALMFIRTSGVDYLRPTSDNASNSALGSDNIRWENVYVASGGIHNSDKRLKNTICCVSDKYEKMFSLLNPCTYIFNDKSRTHIGFISQEVESAMTECGLTDVEFAGFCKDKKTKEIIDEDGNVSIEYVYDENGEHEYIYSLRYSEFIALNTHMIQKTRKENEELRQQLQTQQSEIDSLKESISFLMEQHNQEQN